MRYFTCFILLIIFLCASLSASHAACGKGTIYAVWASPQAEGTTVLRYAAKSRDKWAEPAQLAVGQGFHVTPVIAADRKGAVWIAWTEAGEEEENILRYAVVRQGRMETGRVRPEAKAEQSYAPAILIDQQDRPWLAWSGVEKGRLADIHVSSWQDKGWSSPVLVNQNNSTPDITPLLGLPEGKQLWASWFGMNKQEIYVRFRAELHDGKWRIDKETGSIEDTEAFLARRTHVEPFPEQAGTWLTGALFAGLDCEIQSVSERFASFHK
jgi:hypothetical protein